MGETRINLKHLLEDIRDTYPSDLKGYHNIAATTKKRGTGIGFAGLGAKLSLLIATSVYTETKRGKFHGGTT